MNSVTVAYRYPVVNMAIVVNRLNVIVVLVGMAFFVLNVWKVTIFTSLFNIDNNVEVLLLQLLVVEVATILVVIANHQENVAVV